MFCSKQKGVAMTPKKLHQPSKAFVARFALTCMFTHWQQPIRDTDPHRKTRIIPRTTVTFRAVSIDRTPQVGHLTANFGVGPDPDARCPRAYAPTIIPKSTSKAIAEP